MVPNGWKLVEANDICSSISVGVVIKPSQYYVEKDKGVKAFRSANVREGVINDSDWVYFSDEGHKANKKSQLKVGDVLIVRTGYPGTACVVTPEFEGSNAIDIVIARPKSDFVTSEYLCSYTNSEIGKSQVLNLKGGMAQQHLNVGAYKVLKIKLPPLAEQQKIANILSTWDKAISTTERLIDNSTQQKKALMQQLLTGKHRLLGESGQRFEGEWEEGLLGDLVDVTTGYAFKSNEFVEHKNDSYSIVRMSDLKEGVLNLTQSARVPKSTVVGLERYKLSEGDFIFGMSGSLDNYATVKNVDLPCYLNQRVGKIRAKSNSNQDFVSYIYLSDRVRESILNKAAGAAQLNISIGDLRKTSIRYPNKKEQQKIATVLINADKEIDLLEQQLADLQQEKKALMQVLLTGKVRVVVDGES